MPKRQSKLFTITEFFRTAEVETAQEVLDMCRQILRERKPPQKRKVRKGTTAEPTTVAMPQPPDEAA